MTDSNANSDTNGGHKSNLNAGQQNMNNTNINNSSVLDTPTSTTSPPPPNVSTPTTPSQTKAGSETIYELGHQHRSPLDSPSHVVSERVQTLASQIYNELQKIMSRCSDDEEAVSGLMPLVVNVLESLDLTLIENQQLQVELELCKDDNEQLVAAFEKEKMVKKKVDQRLIELEFQAEEEKQSLQAKVDSLENIVKMLELKAKNSTDHSTRLEEKEAESKTEYQKLHHRYTELLRGHCDLMERVKILIGNDFNGDNNLSSTPTSSGPSSIQSSQALRNFLAKKMEMDERLETETRNAGHRGGHDMTSPVNPKVWLDTELSLEDASIIEDVEDIPRDKEPTSLGMEKEVENLIAENNELLATKNALNIVKDDLIAKVDELQSELTMVKDENHQLTAVKNRLRSRSNSLEEEVKKLKEELEEVKHKLSTIKEDDEEGIPMVQRKRFTRLEMARVLMERNQYKEKLIELQEAVRWTELIRASKSEGEKKSAIWKFFSNLFTPSAATGTTTPPNSGSFGHPGITAGPSLRFSSASPNSVTPALDAMRRRARAQQQSGSGSSDLVMLMDSDLNSDRARALRNIRPHVNRSNGDRIQAYGWSIAAGADTSNVSALKNTSVPVPTYCRPLSGDDVGMKIWCACAVDLSGGEAGFPGSSAPSESDESSGPASIDCRGRVDTLTQSMTSSTMTASTETAIEVGSDEDLDSFNVHASGDAVAALETELKEALSDQTEFITTEKSLSTFVWICSVSNSRSKVTIVNIRSNPSEVLDSFTVKTHLLCIASVPGAKNTDLVGTSDIDMDKVPGLTINKIDEVRVGKTGTLERTLKRRETDDAKEVKESSSSAAKDGPKTKDDVCATLSAADEEENHLLNDERLEKLTEYVKYMEQTSLGSAGDDVATPTSPVYQSMSTCLPTIWLGGQNGILYIHSSIAQWSHCVASIKLHDSILAIAHFRGRVFVALANGTTCIFTRSKSSGEWNFDHYYVLDVGTVLRSSSETSSSSGQSFASSGQSSAAGGSKDGGQQLSVTSSIRCIEVSKGGNIWMGYRNLVLILDPKTFKVIHNLTIHPRKESQVRQLTALGDGVWCSLRLDSTLKLYSSHRPFNHIQDVDIEPYVSKMLSPKAFTFIRVTALKASGGRLWIGTANGVILSIPCDKVPLNSGHGPSTSSSGTGSLANEPIINQSSSVIVSSTGKDGSGRLQVSTFVPTVNSSGAQLSFHGHRDAVKFFVCSKNLVLSGGDGYIDFRINTDYDDDGTDAMIQTPSTANSSKTDKSHLIVWEITTPN